MARERMGNVYDAAKQLSEGKLVVIYDGDEREGEADLVVGARFARPETVETMRKDGGGLLCVAIGSGDAEKLGLPFFTDLLESSGSRLAAMACAKTAYGDTPAFSLMVNHRNVYTGITDNDRSLTITKIDDIVRSAATASGTTMAEEFRKQFYSPGHVFLLIGRGLENRRGHTELSLWLGEKAGLGAMVLCEMLGSGKALSKEKAKAYAKRKGLVFVEGKEIRAEAERL